MVDRRGGPDVEGDVRTLRHYDSIGLLKPAFVADNGYRCYEQEQFLRLQQLLLLRELGLGLGAIAEVLDGQRDEVESLRRHEQWLAAERARLGRLAETVSRTIRSLEGGQEMTAPELFAGFADRQARAEEDLVERYGEGVPEHFATSRERTAGWTKERYLDSQRRWEQLEGRLLEVLRSGAVPDSPRAVELMAEHHAMVSQFWTPDRESYTGLGQLYADAPEFRERYDAKDPRLAEFLRDAAAAYAAARLS